MQRRLFAPLIVAVVLGACSGEPRPERSNNSQTYQLSKREVWNDVLAWADRNSMYAGKGYDWDSNQINVDLTFPKATGHAAADCGANDSQSVWQSRALMVIVLDPISPDETTVTVHSTFREYRYDDMSGKTVVVECTSNGTEEAGLLRAIH